MKKLRVIQNPQPEADSSARKMRPVPAAGSRSPTSAGPAENVAPRAQPESVAPPVTETRSPSILFAAPHRPMFFLGGAMVLVAFVVWTIELAARVGLGSAPTWALPPTWMHALLVLAGVFPPFMFGFLLTAMPRWQGEHDLTPDAWLWPWRFLATGWVLSLVGLVLPGLLPLGLLLALVGWIAVERVLWRVAYNAHPQKLHARTVWWGLAAGGLGLASWLVFTLTGEGAFARFAIASGVWWFMLPVFFTVCHRMVPFFSSNIIENYEMVRPRWALGVVVGASVVHGALAIADLGSLTWIVDAPAAATALWLSWKWRLVPSLRVPLLGMLHIGFVWLGVGLALSAVQSFALMLGHAMLGLAPLHALGVGFFASVLLAMVSRVTLGHSGSKLVADRLTWSLFLGLELVAFVRVAAEIVPFAWSANLMLAAAVGWVAIFAAWALRYMPAYVRPRSDGRPG